MNITFPSPAVDWTPEGGYPPDAPDDGFPWKPKGKVQQSLSEGFVQMIIRTKGQSEHSNERTIRLLYEIMLNSTH